MIKRALPALCVLLLATACTKLAVFDELTIEPQANSLSISVTAETTFSLNPKHAAAQKKVEAGQAAAIAGTDSWSVRFARLSAPEEETVTYRRVRGALERVTRSARIGEDELQQLLSDSNITVDVVHGEGWSELALYPGSGGRASREQQREFDASLEAWASSVARYFTAIHHLYSYMDENPGRAQYVFDNLTEIEHTDDSLLLEEEHRLITAVGEAMSAIADKMDQQEGRAMTLAEEADLLYNPFPARVIVKPPGEVLSSEGFSTRDKELTIEPVELFSAIAALEGKWISPDPLATLLKEEAPTPEELAAMPRKSQAVVSSSEIARAIREQLVRPKAYSVRWRD